MAAIEHITRALVEFLESHRMVALNGFHRVNHRHYVDRFTQSYVWNSDDWDAFRHFGHLIRDRLYHQVTQCVVFRSSPTRLADRCIIIVAGHVWLYIRCVAIVRPSAESEVSTAMYHVIIKADTIVEILLCLLNNALRRYTWEGFRPVTEPSWIELSHHVRSNSTMILIDNLL